MIRCTKHNHKTAALAEKCHAEYMERRVKIRTKGSTTTKVVLMVKNRPPRLTKHGEVWLLVWEEDALMMY